MHDLKKHLVLLLSDFYRNDVGAKRSVSRFVISSFDSDYRIIVVVCTCFDGHTQYDLFSYSWTGCRETSYVYYIRSFETEHGANIAYYCLTEL